MKNAAAVAIAVQFVAATATLTAAGVKAAVVDSLMISCRRVASTRISKHYQQESRGSSSSSSSEWETAPPGSPRPTREEKIVAGFDRLNQRLADFKMKPVEMADDGACQFRAFAHQVDSISNSTLLFLCQSIAILPVATPIGYCCMFRGGQLQLRFDRILAALPCLNSHCRFVLRCWCVSLSVGGCSYMEHRTTTNMFASRPATTSSSIRGSTPCFSTALTTLPSEGRPDDTILSAAEAEWKPGLPFASPHMSSTAVCRLHSCTSKRIRMNSKATYSCAGVF